MLTVMVATPPFDIAQAMNAIHKLLIQIHSFSHTLCKQSSFEGGIVGKCASSAGNSQSYWLNIGPWAKSLFAGWDGLQGCQDIHWRSKMAV